MSKDKLTWLLFLTLLFGFKLGCKTSDEVQADKSKSAFFTEITDEAQIDFVHDPGVDGSYYMPESMGSGAAFLDYDNDGDLDIYLINSGPHHKSSAQSQPVRNRLFQQQSDATFTDVTESSGLGDAGYGMGVAVGDIDNDGDLDVYVTNVGQDALYRNQGDGTFAQVTRSAGIDNPEWGCSAIFFDYNLDGYLDIYVTNYVDFDLKSVCTDRAGRRDYCGPLSFAGVPDKLYRNQGDGSFTDVSGSSGIAAGSSKGLGVVTADFDGNNFPDLYVANDGEPNHLWLNRGDGTFQDLASQSGIARNQMGQAEASMGIAIGDIDNDADFDLFSTHLRNESNTFYRNFKPGVFLDDSAISGLGGLSLLYTGFGTGFFDYDHDGDLDLAVVNGRVTRGPLLTNHAQRDYWDDYAEPNFLFENDGTGRFRNVSDSAGEFGARAGNSRGLAFGDVDNDGDLDLLVTNEGGRARLYRNDFTKKGHWLIVRAFDPELNRDAIGAKVTVMIAEKRWHRIVSPGYSYLCSHDLRAHFGLGEAESVDQIRIKWPDGTVEAFNGVASDQILTIEKGQAEK